MATFTVTPEQMDALIAHTGAQEGQAAAPAPEKTTAAQIADQYQSPVEKAVRGGMPFSQAVRDYVLRGVNPGTDKPNAIQSGLRGALQGATRGWSEELASYPDAALSYLINKGRGTQTDDFETTRRLRLQELRAKNRAAEQE